MTDKARSLPSTRESLPGSRRPAPPAPLPSEARVRVPSDVRDRIDEAARARGVSRPEFVRDALESALVAPAADPVAGDGQHSLHLNGSGPESDASVAIPEAYVARSPLPAAPADAAAGGSASESPPDPPPELASDPSAPPEPLAAAADPEPEPAPARPPAYVPPELTSAGRPRSSAFLIVFLAVLAFVLAGGALAFWGHYERFAVHAPAPGSSLAGAYVLDRWTGHLWFCDAAQRGRDAPRCVRFTGFGR